MVATKNPQMWALEEHLGLESLTPPEQLWIIAQAVEENGGPRDYVLVLRHLAERLEDMRWWLQEPLEASHGQCGPRDLSGHS